MQKYTTTLHGLPLQFFVLPSLPPARVSELVKLLKDQAPFSTIKSYVQREPDRIGWLVNFRANAYEQFSVFEIAVQFADTQVVSYLTEFVQDFSDHQNNHQDSALQLAAFFNKMDVVRLLLDKGCSVTHQNAKGYTALHHAIQQGHQEIASLLLQMDSSLVNISTHHFLSPLHMAVFSRSPEMVADLIRHGARVDARNCVGQTAIFLALEKSYFDCFSVLFEQGEADVTLRDFFGRRVDQLVDQTAQCDVWKKIRQRQATRLKVAVIRDDLFRIMQIFSNDIEVNVQDAAGMTVLHHACQQGKITLIQRILLKGGDVNMVDALGKKPIDYLDDALHADFESAIESAQNEKQIRSIPADGYSIPLGVRIAVSLSFINYLTGRQFDQVTGCEDDSVTRCPTVVKLNE